MTETRTAAISLLQAVHARLAGDAGLVAMLGPGGIHDRLLPRPKLPAVVIGELETRDLSTSTEAAEEHFLTLEVWTEGEGRRGAQEIAAKTIALLDDADLALDGAVLVSLLRTVTRARREPKTRNYLVEIRFRAVTE
ncbi:DUF3168 domain-containing protein [Neorhizobium sp. NCHU2750]|uniref:DUF3168 domain-containing protein n=1 Tax=Neorhizobium sp. NCHU2750 TaxID=1825976 RepID=UPI000E734079|nr:hypothetical protein NCHU2750_08380 [Neorhizobium sp. NCHU2750]